MLDKLQHIINDAQEAIHGHSQPAAPTGPPAQESDPKYALLKEWAQRNEQAILEAGINALDVMRGRERLDQQIFLLVLDFDETAPNDSPKKFSVASAGYSPPLDVYKTFAPFFGNENGVKQAFRVPHGLRTMLRCDPVAYALSSEVPNVEGRTRDFNWLGELKAKLAN